MNISNSTPLDRGHRSHHQLDHGPALYACGGTGKRSGHCGKKTHRLCTSLISFVSFMSILPISYPTHSASTISSITDLRHVDNFVKSFTHICVTRKPPVVITHQSCEFPPLHTAPQAIPSPSSHPALLGEELESYRPETLAVGMCVSWEIAENISRGASLG